MTDEERRIDSGQSARAVSAPEIPYRPRLPQAYRPTIGLIGCGGIAPYHLEAYRDAGLKVAVLCDVDEKRARRRRDAYYPDAATSTNYQDLLAREDIDIVDIATNVDVRPTLVEAALEAGKHVLSQKPFVVDLDEGARLADLAGERGLKLAVNQNGRWAPHFSYIRNAIAAGVIGEIDAAHFAVHWDHSWTAGTPFDEMRHLVLYDFGIHWFDILTCFMGSREATSVFATVATTGGQRNKVPMLAQVAVAYENAQASLIFDAATMHGAQDDTFVTGRSGTLSSSGPDLSHQAVTLYNDAGRATPALEGEWFKDGFLGTMAELICAIDEDREPSNSGRDNLESLGLCFAAMASADTGKPVVPGTVRKMPRAARG